MEMLKIRPDLPIVMSTGYNKKITKSLAFQMGIKAVIYKPIEKAKLAKIIRSTLDGPGGNT